MDAPEIYRLLVEGWPAEAEAQARALLDRNGSRLDVWGLLGKALRAQGRYHETLEIQEALVEVRPGDFSARFDLSETLLLLGDFDRGWREYRHRYSLPHTRPIERPVRRPRWNGEPLNGKTLLVHDEQGYGDVFQFLRLIPLVKARTGARIILDIHPDLESFGRRLEGIDMVVPRGQPVPDFDVFCELMSLPMAMGLRREDLPGPIPYLSALPDRVQRWRTVLGGLPRPLVGLVWAGSPTHGNDANRSLALAQLAPLGAAEGTFLALQKGPAAAQAAAPPAGLTVRSLDRDIADFDDTAAILEVIDLMISVDSSPAHLAGALGRPVWTLLPFSPDWRWLLDREDSPWYPSMRLFRQPARGDWTTPIDRVADALRTLA
ncbi:MAG: tetratricopeptide repeat-containing glycosyltransferase family protein [Alphaproteobacteria bacterium]|nr:tetratricopeptide repeat-containing glycosyltransferase family protein [Alphaproteobacteria bacterium]MBU1516624.1 tetratricopeptide repeat-containing glycosyltransferase family protein [Alphaproteobacteria bacterium]MBU2094380.1 tetratricopeptide repeat-containing glycosyltransferase family protein [Alphaproteobacteria bacterium]MBU2153265.1 tetratricopeptide repeat-containing glycosyltransferase family protein [Alphaproteobacteria bacterium]MBU2307551.1 tetratricopeptide repeat-containing 